MHFMYDAISSMLSSTHYFLNKVKETSIWWLHFIFFLIKKNNYVLLIKIIIYCWQFSKLKSFLIPVNHWLIFIKTFSDVFCKFLFYR